MYTLNEIGQAALRDELRAVLNEQALEAIETPQYFSAWATEAEERWSDGFEYLEINRRYTASRSAYILSLDSSWFDAQEVES